jgi:hypothetical protein
MRRRFLSPWQTLHAKSEDDRESQHTAQLAGAPDVQLHPCGFSASLSVFDVVRDSQESGQTGARVLWAVGSGQLGSGVWNAYGSRCGLNIGRIVGREM